MFYENLKSIMKQQGVNQSELSKLTGIGKPSISQYLSGKNTPGAVYIKKISDALNCTVETLKGEPTKHTPVEMPKSKNLTVGEAAKRMGKSRRFLYDALQSGTCPFGFAVKGRGEKWSYFIPVQRFESYLNGM